MTRLCLLAVAVAALVACSHSAAPPPVDPTVAAVPAADPAPCPDVAVQEAKLMAADPIKPMVASHCVDDRWSVELRKCVLLARSQQELEPCHKDFTGNQFESLKRDMDAMKTADSSSPATAPTSATPPAKTTPAAPDVPPPANAMPK
ncbi:MAG: hypothetical protein ABJE66_14180 [Deltaproteobacteria bacterium]